MLEGDTGVCSVGCGGACSGCLWIATFRGDVAETVRGDVVGFWLFVEMNLFSLFFYGGVQGGETSRDVQGRSVVIVSVSVSWENCDIFSPKTL